MEKSGDVGPTAVALRNWAPSSNIYFTVEMGDNNSIENSAELYRYLCSGGASCAPTPPWLGWPKLVGDPVPGPTSLHVAMAIREDPSNVEVVDVIRRDKWDEDCDDDGLITTGSDLAEFALDLPNFDYRTDTDDVTGRQMVSTNMGITTNNACTDSGVSQLKNDSAAVLNACYTFKADPTNSADDRVHCNDDFDTPTYLWHFDVEMSSLVVEDHPAFSFKEGERVVAASRRPSGANDDTIRFHFPDAGISPEPLFDLPLDGDVVGGIYPDIISLPVVGGGNVMYAVWEADGGKEIRMGRCGHLSTCESDTDWHITSPHATVEGVMKYPEVVQDGLFQLLIWQEDADQVSGGDIIYASTRCKGAGLGWSAPERIKAPGFLKSQSIWIGNPHVVLNSIDNVAHVAFLETGGGAAEVWWARMDYTDCP